MVPNYVIMLSFSSEQSIRESSSSISLLSVSQFSLGDGTVFKKGVGDS